MKKIKFLSVLLLATLILSACGKEKINEGMDVNEESSQTEISEKKSLKELLDLGGSQKCTFEVNEEGQVTKGEILIIGDKFKQSLELMTEEGPMKIYTISDGEYFYSWNDAIKGSGSKMKIEKETNVSNEDVQNQKEINWEEEFNYKCNPTIISGADLAIPSDIEFVDLSEMIQNFENMTPEELQRLAPSEE